MPNSSELTALQWLGPSMACDGLITDGDWVAPAATAAAALFADERLHLPAQFLAVLDRFALDYVKQAPVLVVAVAHGRQLRYRRDRQEAGQGFIARCRAGTKLADLLRAYGLAPQLRALSPQVLRQGQHDLLQALSMAVAPSSLAQAIPPTPEQQGVWLSGLERWRRHMARHFRDANLLLDWATVNFRDDAGRVLIRRVAEFAGQNLAAFDRDWTFAQAHTAARRWLAARAPAKETRRPDWRTIVDYAPLPSHAKAAGLELHALQTREALFEEGALMRHCVYRYSDEVEEGSSRIYSVRRDGRRVATLEIVRLDSSSAPRFRVAQLRGPCNARPTPEIVASVRTFMSEVMTAAGCTGPEISPTDERVQRARAALRRRFGDDIYAAWFNQMQFEFLEARSLGLSFPCHTIVNRVCAHYNAALSASCSEGFDGVTSVVLSVRPPGHPFVAGVAPAG